MGFLGFFAFTRRWKTVSIKNISAVVLCSGNYQTICVLQQNFIAVFLFSRDGSVVHN